MTHTDKIDIAQKLLHESRFYVSAERLDQCPPDQGIEIAFAGRSNAGKSSAINRLTSQKSLARTSKTPGRTRLLNFFSLDHDLADTPDQIMLKLVDLPGYGYAKVGKSMRENWQRHLDAYLTHRECLRGMMLMMDIRHPLKEFDTMMLHWADEAKMPVHILLTKADKLSYGQAKQTLLKVQSATRKYNNPVSAQLFSSTKGTGCDEAWAQLADWLDLQLPDAETASLTQ